MAEAAHIATRLHLHKQSGILDLSFGDQTYSLSAEFLRVYSPSAEVRGHGQGNEVLQTGKRQVRILGIEPVGNYALKLIFSDGHDSGLYDWTLLWHLATEQEALWQDYLKRLDKAGASRDK